MCKEFRRNTLFFGIPEKKEDFCEIAKRSLLIGRRSDIFASERRKKIGAPRMGYLLLPYGF